MFPNTNWKGLKGTGDEAGGGGLEGLEAAGAAAGGGLAKG